MKQTEKLVDAWRNPPGRRDLQQMSVADNLAVGLIYIMTPLLFPIALTADVASALVR